MNFDVSFLSEGLYLSCMPVYSRWTPWSRLAAIWLILGLTSSTLIQEWLDAISGIFVVDVKYDVATSCKNCFPSLSSLIILCDDWHWFSQGQTSSLPSLCFVLTRCTVSERACVTGHCRFLCALQRLASHQVKVDFKLDTSHRSRVVVKERVSDFDFTSRVDVGAIRSSIHEASE